MLTIKEVFHLTNRQFEGFVCSVFAMQEITLLAPDYSTLSKRGKTLLVRLPKKNSGSVHLMHQSHFEI
jgi:hypothetical protein